MFHFGTEIDPEFENSVGELTNKLVERDNYERTDTINVASTLIEAEDRRNTYETWLTSSEYNNRASESLRRIIEEAKRENERGAPQGERQGIRDNQGDGNESSKSDGRGGERIRKQSAVDTQQFFSDTVKGNNKPLKPWEPMYPLSKEQSRVREVWKRFDDGFSEHISTSIPFFREAQFSKIAAISELYDKATVVDLGGSQGDFIKSISSINPNIRGINVDINEDMKNSFDKNPVSMRKISKRLKKNKQKNL